MILARKLVVSRSGHGSRGAPRPSVPGRVRFAVAPHVELDSSGSDEKAQEEQEDTRRGRRTRLCPHEPLTARN